ncbi:hypothetical protein Y1Q_0004668 [Alligator mississippiensis]|uniref:Uncharacterized protein n=1 Tax=Alligator mississippiensis TaxID=8496 RepID=A0A151NLZ3_ALLMI|nr:hypothetical protein Y1Q_0004668 [Alligator mississippiensis]
MTLLLEQLVTAAEDWVMDLQVCTAEKGLRTVASHRPSRDSGEPVRADLILVTQQRRHNQVLNFKMSDLDEPPEEFPNNRVET